MIPLMLVSVQNLKQKHKRNEKRLRKSVNLRSQKKRRKKLLLNVRLPLKR